MPSFLVLKPEYPHESASNSLFSVKKGEILECPPDYKPSNAFQVCETIEAAEQYIKLISLVRGGTVVKSVEKAEEKGKSQQPTVIYPLFRKVSGLGDEEPSYQLFSRDIHRFLSRDEAEIIADFHAVNLHCNTAARLLEYEQKHFSRKAIMAILEEIVNSEAEEKAGKLKQEELTKEASNGYLDNTLSNP